MSSILAGNVVETPKILRVQDFRCFLFLHISLYFFNKILKIHDKVSIAVFVYVYCKGRGISTIQHKSKNCYFFWKSGGFTYLRLATALAVWYNETMRKQNWGRSGQSRLTTWNWKIWRKKGAENRLAKGALLKYSKKGFLHPKIKYSKGKRLFHKELWLYKSLDFTG